MVSPTTTTSNDWVVVKVFETGGGMWSMSTKVIGPFSRGKANAEAKFLRDTLTYEPENAEPNLIYAQARPISDG